MDLGLSIEAKTPIKLGMYRILCIKDSHEVKLILQRSLVAPKMELEVVSTLSEGRSKLEKNNYDLILLDISLPDGDGLQFCSEIKNNDKNRFVPVFILTSNNTIEDKTIGFSLGIDDFITKPFDPVELVLRVESRIRKNTEKKEIQDVYSIGSLRILYSTQKVQLIFNNEIKDVKLSTTEFKILSFLARNKEQVKTREQIISAVWGNGFHLSDRTIDSHISRIRKKINKSDTIIEAIMNSGYQLSLQKTDLKAS